MWRWVITITLSTISTRRSRLDQNVAESWANQALVYEHNGDKAKAANSYARAVQLGRSISLRKTVWPARGVKFAHLRYDHKRRFPNRERRFSIANRDIFNFMSLFDHIGFKARGHQSQPFLL